MKFGRPALATICWIVGYFCTLWFILYGLNNTRETQLSAATNKLEDAWAQWRDAAAAQAAGSGSVKRKIPKSTLPPIRVLFADHYTTITIAATFFGSFLYGMLYFFTRGILTGDRGELPDNESPRDTVPTPGHPPD